MWGWMLWGPLSSALAFQGVPTCPPARYVVRDQPILAGATLPGVDVVAVSATQIAVDSGCAPAVVRVRGTRHGTRVRATFRECRDVKGKARLKGLIDIGCTTLEGTFIAKKEHVRRPFSATLSTCGDRAWDAGAEACDAGTGCAVDAHCTAACACEPGAETTTTTVAGATTTSVTTGVSTTSTSVVQRPDLVPTTLTAPGAAVTGAPLSISWTVLNQGAGAAKPSWSDVVFLSQDGVLGAGDRNLGAFARTVGLDPTETYEGSEQIAAFPDVAPGDYFLILKTDNSNQQSETEESNNTRAVPITIQAPDLEPTDVSAPSAADAGTGAIVSWTIGNHGTGAAAPPWVDAVFLSRDGSIGTGDRLLGTFAHTQAVAAGDSYTSSQEIALPSIAAGAYFLLVRTDNGAALFEANETDNTAAAAITIQTPDLVPTALGGPTSAAPGQTVTVSWTVENQGTGGADRPWKDAIYFSGDALLQPGDPLLGSFSHALALPAGQHYDMVGQSVVLPGNLAPGSYFLLIRTDDGTGVFEANESNNVRAVALTITP